MTTRIALRAVTMLALAAPAAQSSTLDASASLDRFGQQLAGGLPRPGFSITATDEAGMTVVAQLAVDEKLTTVVTLPNGGAIETFTGSWDGHPATISRGDGQLLIDTDEPGHTVTRFDSAIAARLPARVHLDDASTMATHSQVDNDDLVVLGALGGDIVFADGSRGQMYDATWHGASVVATRSGTHLDITSMSTTGIEVTEFTAGSDDIGHGSVASVAVPGGSPSRSRRSAGNDLTPNRLTFHLMLHDDVGMSSQRIHASYVAWWLADLQRNIAPGKKVDLFYSQHIPGVTDVRYQYVGSLHDWSDVIGNYAQEQHVPRTYKHKFMLIVKDLPEPERHGRSWQRGSEGIASISGRYPEVAHQLGHLLGATHANAEVRYGGWWCETNMYAPSLLLRSNCYAYSRANMRLMDEYIRSGQEFVADSRWSEDR
jgi:hypothetical protein